MAEYYNADEISQKLRFMFWGDQVFSTYSNGADIVKAGYPYWACNDCQYFRVTVKIPQGMMDLLREDEDRMADILEAFNRILEKYLPVYAKLLDDQGEANVVLTSETPEIIISGPPPDLVIADVLYIYPDSVRIPNTGDLTPVEIYATNTFTVL